MKKIMLSLIIVLCGLMVNAQKIKEADVPVDVKNKFAAMYPGIKGTRWEKEEGKFEVSFKNNKEEISLLFEPNGTHVQTEVEIPVTSLPQAVNDYVTKNFKGKKVGDAARITAADGTVTYEAEIDGDDYYFDIKGDFLHKEKDDDHDNDR